jgi:hypothetical protein
MMTLCIPFIAASFYQGYVLWRAKSSHPALGIEEEIKKCRPEEGGMVKGLANQM